MGFERQGKMTAQVVSELLDGKKPQEIPIETLPGAYVFDSHELSKWNIAESTLPPESVILFEEPSVWERNKWLWAIILGLSALAAYLLYSRKQLKQAKESQRKLSGRLINAQEQERSRLAREIHDDFSQRLAVMALQLENIAEEVPLSYKEVHRQLHEVEDSASELGSELLVDCDVSDMKALDKTFEALKSRGVRFETDVLEYPWGYVALFVDPDGNRLQIREGR